MSLVVTVVLGAETVDSRAMDGTVSIRTASEADFDALTELWERSARSSHAFMADDEFVELKPHIRDLLLPSMDVWVAESGDETLGFVGARASTSSCSTSPLRRRAEASALVCSRISPTARTRSVEVYADNSVGLGFYLSQGFRETRRNPTDAAGRAFPIVHLERDPA